MGSGPSPQPLQAAETLNVHLIEVGSHGYRGLDRVLGTTAGRIANRSHTNVLIAHDANTR